MSELKKAVNTVTGITRELGPHIYNNRFRMKSGNWQLIETPDPIDTDMIPVHLNVPVHFEPQYEIPAVSEDVVQAIIEPTKPTANKPKSKNK